MKEKFEKENKRYLSCDKKCNALDLELYKFYDFVEFHEGETEHEQFLLRCLEKEINELRYTIECYKNEIELIHIKKIENIKNEKDD